MTMEAALAEYLSADTGLTALIGDRLYPLVMPDGCPKPAVTYQRISTPRIQTNEGTNPLARVRVRLVAWGTKYSDAKNVAARIEAAMSHFAGVFGDLVVQGTQLDDSSDDYEPDTKLFRSDVEVLIWCNEAAT